MLGSLADEGAFPKTTPCLSPSSHGQNGGHHVQGGDEDAQLSDECRQEECPRWLAICFPMAKHLRAPEKELLLPPPLPTSAAPSHPTGLSPMSILIGVTSFSNSALLWMKHRQATDSGSNQHC